MAHIYRLYSMGISSLISWLLSSCCTNTIFCVTITWGRNESSKTSSSMSHSCHLQAPTAHLSTSGVEQFTPFADLRTLCIYDWELATVNVPQHDVAEFLAFTLQPSTPLTTRLELVEFYWQHLQYYSGREYPWKQ